MPLGANMAVRRDVFPVVGPFRADLGRADGSVLLGQEVPEWLLRVRQAGLTGLYVPAMEVHHHIPAHRLTPRYFRRWWFGKGVSRAALERIQPVTELGIDLLRTPHLLGVPRFMYGSLLRDVVGGLRALCRKTARGRLPAPDDDRVLRGLLRGPRSASASAVPPIAPRRSSAAACDPRACARHCRGCRASSRRGPRGAARSSRRRCSRSFPSSSRRRERSR